MSPWILTLIILALWLLVKVILLILICTGIYKPEHGLIIANGVFRYLFQQNTDAPAWIHYTSQCIGGDYIEIEEVAYSIRYSHFLSLPDQEPCRTVMKSLRQSGGCYYQAKNGIDIGAGSRWGPGVKMISANHDRDDLGSHVKGPGIKIGRDVWIGSNAVLLPGADIPDNTIIGAGSVVGPGESIRFTEMTQGKKA